MDLRDIINSIYPISEKSMDRLLSCSLELGRPKGYRLLEEGKIESDIFFIKRGIVRAYVSHEGKDITFWIGKEGATIMSLKSYVKNEAGYETIELMEDSLLYCLKRSDLYRLFEEDIDIANWGRKLAELEFLAETAGIVGVRRFTQRLPQPSARIYVGPGKLEEIAAYCKEEEIDVAIFDDELSPSQTRNIEAAMPCRILDRTRLILDIFMSRAQTAYAKTQVQLANYQYMLPRLSGMWTHLERQRGGTGTRGGAGEREIETDRRIIRTIFSTRMPSHAHSVGRNRQLRAMRVPDYSSCYNRDKIRARIVLLAMQCSKKTQDARR